jgi:hypothetical protein
VTTGSRLRQGDGHPLEFARRLRRAADSFALGCFSLHSENRRAGGESGRRVQQSGRDFLGVRRLPHAPHRLVQLVRGFAPRASAGFARFDRRASFRKALRVVQKLGNPIVQELPQSRRWSAGSHS